MLPWLCITTKQNLSPSANFIFSFEMKGKVMMNELSSHLH